jgi:hypothetical protein
MIFMPRRFFRTVFLEAGIASDPSVQRVDCMRSRPHSVRRASGIEIAWSLGRFLAGDFDFSDWPKGAAAEKKFNL